MKFFLDANILISVLNKEYPSYAYTVRILSLAADKKNIVVTSSVALAIAFYYAEKKHGRIKAKEKVGLLMQHLDIADCGHREAEAAVKNKKVHDFEDGLQYYAALHSNCTCIVSNDLDDFYFSDIQVLDPERFFKKYAQ